MLLQFIALTLFTAICLMMWACFIYWGFDEMKGNKKLTPESVMMLSHAVAITILILLLYP